MTWSTQQEQALVAVRQWFIDPNSPQIFRLFGFAGTGKTTLSQEIANLIEDDGDGKVLYAAFTGKAALVMRQKGCHKASTIHSLIYTLDDDGTFIPKFILNEDSDVKDAKLVIIDECFVSGTLVDTPFGPQRIETLAPGGLIVNAAGVDRIVATARKEAIHLVRLKFGDATLTCSGNHPFFTQRGLISASELRPGDKLVETSSAMRLLRQAVHAEANAAEPVLRQSLLDALAQKPSRLQAARLHPAACAEVGRREEALAYVGTPRCHQRNRTNSQLEPKFASRGPEQDQRRASRDESSAAAPRGQWARSNEAATPSSSCARTRMDHGADRLNQNTTAEVAGGIQDRRWASRPQDRDRSGWSIAFCEADAGERQAQGGVSAFRRVDSVEVLEQSDPRLDQHRHADGKLYLYDLQAERHSSFSVEGILVHNCSMVGAELAHDLLSYGTKILVVGDPAQLPPVQDAGFFTNRTPDFMLTEVHRQARDNPIIRMSMDVREGKSLEHGDFGACKVLRRGELDPADALAADMILVGKNDTRNKCNRRHRELKKINSRTPLKGERLVCLKNDRAKNLFNGGTWTVEKVRKANGAAVRMVVAPEDAGDARRSTEIKVHPYFFEGREGELEWEEIRKFQQFTFGYALTVHKAQGSQWNNVVLFDESGVFGESRSRWLYTGLTRAAQKL